MSTGEIVIKLELDDKDFKGSISGATGDIRRFEKAVKSSGTAIQHNERHHKTWARTLRDSVIVLGLARHAIENVSAVLFAFPNAVIRANAELERMTALMTGLSTETGGMAEAQADAQKSIDYLFDTAKRAPFEIGALTDSFVKMKSVGLDPMSGIFQGLVDSVAKFGGTPEQLKRASIAIQQMAGKGVISMEELRQQLGESVPDAMMIMARSMGISMGELVETVSTGTVEAKNALAAMARQMRIENSGAALRMSQTWDGMLNRMKTSITLAAKEIGDAGFFDAVKGQLSVIVDDTLQDPRFFQFMRDIGRAMEVMVNGTAALVGGLYQFRGAIIDVTQFLVGFFVVAKAQKHWSAMSNGLDAARGGFKTLGVEIGKMAAEIKASNLHVRQHNWAIAQSVVPAQNKIAALEALRIATNRAATAFKAFFTAIGGWSTVLLLGIPLAIAAFDKLSDKTLDLVKEIDRSNPQLMTQEQLDALRETVTKYETIKQKVNELKQAETELTQQQLANMQQLQERGQQQLQRSQLETKQRDYEEALEGKTPEEWAQDALAAEQALLNNMLTSFARNAELRAEGALRASIISYKDSLNDLIDRQKDLSDEEFMNSRIELEKTLAAQVAAQFDEQIAAEQAKLEEQRALQTEEAKKQVEIQKLKIEQLKKIKAEGLEVFDGTPSELKLLSDEDAKEKLNKLEQFLQSRQKMLAKYKAKSEDENPYLAEFEAMVELGTFAKSTEEDIAAAREVMKELWQERQKWDAQNKESQAFGDSLERIDQLTGMINSKFAQRENQNPLMRDAIEADKLKEKLKEVGAEIGAMTSIDQDARRDALEQLYQMGLRVEENARRATVAQMGSAAEEMRRELLPEMERTEAEYDALIAKAWEWRRAQGALSTEELEAFNAYLSALNAKMADEMKTPMDELMEQWSDSTTQMQNLWTNTMESFVDTLTDGLMEGKLELASFVEEFGRMVIKMQLQKAAAGIASGLGSAFSGGSSIAASSPGGAGPLNMAVLAKGGVMTPKGLAQLETYSNGGIANRPQLALYGEGRQPEAYVPLPDGRTIPVTVDGKGMQSGGAQGMPVTVNLMNQSGQPMEADSSEARFDGKQWVLDVVLTGMNRPGNFRSGMKTALKK